MSAPCPYCGAPTEFISSTRVYRKNYGWLLACSRYPQCDAYVGCHGKTKEPKGRLANAELRAAKIAAHGALGIEGKDCHVGMFDVDQCRKVVEVCQTVPTGALQRLGKAIRLARTAADLTQEQLGKKIGASQNFIYTAELGKTDPGVIATMRIAEACRVPFETLLASIWQPAKVKPDDLLKALLEKLR